MAPPSADLPPDRKAKLWDELVAFLVDPSFGSRTKREIDLKVFELLYRERLERGDLPVGVVAQQLTVPRARARSLVLEARTRLVADEEARARELRRLLQQWARHGEVEREGARLRLVIDDPFVRDLLRNHAYERGLLLDSSFAGEIVSLRWSDYAALIASLLDERHAAELEQQLGAELRKRLAKDEERAQAFERELAAWKSEPAPERVKRTVAAAAPYVPWGTLAALFVGALR